MTEIQKIFGIPGSGKTEKLLTIIEKSIESGQFPNIETAIDSICFVTFSRSASKDAIERIGNKFNVPGEKQGQYFTTIHGVCKRLLGWDFKEGELRLEKPEDKNAFLQKFGFTYPINKYKKLNEEEIPEIILEEIIGNTDEENLFRIINYCHHRCLPLDRWKDIGTIFFDYIDASDIPYYAEEWGKYKEKHSLVSFDDMLIETLKLGLYPPIQLLVVDEFQDLSLLLFKVIKSWMPHMEKVVVAGDDDQNLYNFAGASVDFLLKLKAKKTILGCSHRVPYDILQKARKHIERVENREYKDFKSDKEGGSFYYLRSPDIHDIIKMIPIDKDVYFLFRTNFIVKNFVENHLIPNGIPYTNLRFNKTCAPDVWTYELMDIKNAMVHIQNNQALSRNEVSRLINILPSCSKRKLDGFVRYGMKTWLKKNTEISEWNNTTLLNRLLTRIPSWDNRWILSHFTELQSKAYRRNIENNRGLLSPYRINVGTFHSAKGLQADIVFVFNNHSSIIENAILEGGQSVIDAEIRNYYVGMTRAKESLIIVDNFFDNFVFDLDVV